MSVPDTELKRLTDAAQQLDRGGFFARVKQGDERAASYFARLTAYIVNPGGNPSGFGVLRKTGAGFNVDGYADGAVVYGSDPNDLHNVIKLVTQIGTTWAGIGNAEQERRESDIWEAPKPLTLEQMRYLNPAYQPTDGGTVTPPPTPPVVVPPAQSVDLGPLMAQLGTLTQMVSGIYNLVRDNDEARKEQIADVRNALQNGLAVKATVNIAAKLPYFGAVTSTGSIDGSAKG